MVTGQLNLGTFPRAPVVPPQVRCLDPPGTHPSPTFSEGTTGALGFAQPEVKEV